MKIQKHKKSKYVVKVKDKISEYFPEEASTMILEYLKKQAEIYNANKEIKRAVITIPAHFNNLQRFTKTSNNRSSKQSRIRSNSIN